MKNSNSYYKTSANPGEYALRILDMISNEWYVETIENN
jgi:hypothetical protein